MTTVLSKTQFEKGLITDAVAGVNAVFSRASVKANFQTGNDTASGSPQIETVVTSKNHASAIVDDHADGPTDAIGSGNTGLVWGRCQGDLTNLYMLNPMAGTGWLKVKTFSVREVRSVHISQYSGAVFVCLNFGETYRSALGDGTDDWTLIKTFPHSSLYGKQWSFADKGNGTLWLAEYGGSFLADDNAAQRIYRSDDDGLTWSEIFKFSVDAPADWHTGIHLHKIIYNPYNDTLYMSHGDTDPNYIYKSAGGISGNWQKIASSAYLQYGTTYVYAQPTSAIVRPDGKIIWFDDSGRTGAWLHDPSDDSFSFINMSISSSSFFFDAKVIDGVVYAATESENNNANVIAVFDPLYPYDVIWLDSVASGQTGQGWEYVAGKGNDGYVYFQYKDGATVGTKKYRVVSLSRKSGLTVDPAITNLHGDPFSDIGSGGWGAYTNRETPGGFYGAYYMACKATNTNRPAINRTDPIVVVIYARRNAVPTGSTTIKIFPRWMQGASTILASATTVEFAANRVPEDYYKKFSFFLDPTGSPVGTDSMRLDISPVLAGNFRIGAVEIFQGSYRERLIQRSRIADSYTTTLPAALPTTCTIVGVCSPRYQFDATGQYSLFSAKNASGTSWFKLIIHNGQLKIIDDAHDNASPVLATTTGLPLQTTNIRIGDPPPDIYFWALRFEAGVVTLMVSTQRSNLETVAAAYSPSNDLTVLYDGCSETAGEEIGGSIIRRLVFSDALGSEDIKTYWSGPNKGRIVSPYPLGRIG